MASAFGNAIVGTLVMVGIAALTVVAAMLFRFFVPAGKTETQKLEPEALAAADL